MTADLFTCPDCFTDDAGTIPCSAHAGLVLEARNTDTEGSDAAACTNGPASECPNHRRPPSPFKPSRAKRLDAVLGAEAPVPMKGETRAMRMARATTRTATAWWWSGGTERGRWYRLLATGADLDVAVLATQRGGHVVVRGSIEVGPPETPPSAHGLKVALDSAGLVNPVARHGQASEAHGAVPIKDVTPGMVLAHGLGSKVLHLVSAERLTVAIKSDRMATPSCDYRPRRMYYHSVSSAHTRANNAGALCRKCFTRDELAAIFDDAAVVADALKVARR